MPFYVTITGSKQGVFKGESTDARHAQSILGSDFEFGASTPYDNYTGQPTGKRQYRPVRFVKESGAASPQILQALATGELLTSVLFEFVVTGPSGVEVTWQTLKLQNAIVIDFQRGGEQAPKHPTLIRDHELERVSFTFQQIVWTFEPSSGAFNDSWNV